MENLVAVKVKIADILNGEFVEAGNESHVKLPTGVSAVKIRALGTVVEKFVSEKKTYGALTLDDSSETIAVRFFKDKIQKMDDYSKGDLVDVIGYVKKYESEIYVSPVIVAKIEDPNFEVLRKLELMEQNSQVPTETVVENLSPAVLEKIKGLDSGDGAEIEKVIESLNTYEDSKILETIRALMHKGEIFEPSKGVVKRVE